MVTAIIRQRIRRNVLKFNIESNEKEGEKYKESIDRRLSQEKESSIKKNDKKCYKSSSRENNRKRS